MAMAMRPGSASGRSLAQQKHQVKRGLAATPQLGQIWQPLAISWFESWKEYVDFDNESDDKRAQEEIDSLYPGPIDNSSLAGNYGDEMNRNLVEGKDYILLPGEIVTRLIEIYKGGPEFGRKVLNKGSAYNPVYFVDLFPIRFEIYKWDKDTSELPQKPAKVLYYPSRFPADKLVHEMSSELNIYKKLRCWVRVTDGNASNEPNTNRMQVVSDSSSADSKDDGDYQGSAKRVKTGRMLTAEVTDLMGSDFRLLRKLKDMPVLDLLGRNDCIELLCEVVDSYSPGDADWPRFQILQKWKEGLRLGDVIDAQDSSKTWYEAVVMDVSDTGDIGVHFKGWSSDFDETISRAQRDLRIQPLYTMTSDWRSALDEDEKLELRISAPGTKAVWLPATVSEVDLPNQRVQVAFDVSKALLAIKQHGDEAALEQFRKEHFSESDSKMDDGGDDDKVKQTLRWVNLHSEDICDIYTHTEKPVDPYANRYGNSYSSNYNSRVIDRDEWGEKSTVGTPKVAGAVGLQNLGNTCFMNSVLQCLSNTQLLTDVFTSHRYKTQINTDNALGHGGKLAQVYAKLIKDMWCNSYTKIVPREFKRTIGEFQPQFAGYDQQDSQELMGFLLDGLHEDLNRCRKKPAVSKIESKGREDDLISREAWRRFLLRNDSELVDRLYGQLKSHVTCTNCKNESVTFDAFNCLSLPIPIKTSKTVSMIVSLLPYGSVPYQVDVEVEPTDRIGAVKQKLLKKLEDLGILDPYAPLPPVPGGRSTLKTARSAKEEETSPATSDDYEFVTHSDADTQGASSISRKSSSLTMSAADAKNREGRELEDPKSTRLTVNTRTGDDDYKSDLNSLRSPQKASGDEKYADDTNLKNLALGGASDADDAKDGTDGNNTDINTIERYRPAAGQVLLHIGTLFHANGRVGKTLEDNVAAGELTSSNVGTIVAFQLAAQCPYKALTYGYNSRDSDKEANSYVNYVDVMTAIEVVDTYSYNTKQTRLEFIARPQRLVITRDATNGEIHEVVWQLVKRYIEPENRYLYDGVTAPKPYKIATSTAWGTNMKGPVPVDDELFQIGPSDSIVVLWETANKSAIHVDKSELDATRTAEAPVEKKRAKRITIQDCIDKFVEREQLAPEETLYCSNCKQHLAPVKKMDIWAAPDVLILHLKRFQYIPGQYFVHRDKISELVDFPIENLDLSTYVRGPKHPEAPPVYDLYAVSQHSGGLGGGHYTAVCKNPIDGNWYNFNDSFVSETTAQSAVNEMAYVLFYRRKTGGVKWAGVTPLEHPGLPDED